MARKTKTKKKNKSSARPKRKTSVGLQPVKLIHSDGESPLEPNELRWRFDSNSLPFESTEEIEPLLGVIGQDSAVDSLRFGLETRAPGQNIFVRGLAGTGRKTLIRRLLEEIRLSCPETKDYCYVHNFAEPDRPRLIALPRGKGPAFQHRVDELIDFIRDDLGAALSSESMTERLRILEKDSQAKVDAIVQPFEKLLEEGGLALVSFRAGPDIQNALVPRIEGKPISLEDFENLRITGQISSEQFARFRDLQQAFQHDLDQKTAQVNEVRAIHGNAVLSLWQNETRTILADLIAEARKEFPVSAVEKFLVEVVEDIVNRRRRAIEKGTDFTRIYRVNVVRTCKEGDECPIIVENVPTRGNLLGSIEQSMIRGEGAHSDHLMIRAGSLLRADGGFLILEARDVLRERGAWHALVRTLRTCRLEIIPPEFAMPWSGPSLKPEPIEINVKVLLLGDFGIYYLLDEFDHDFPNLFKILSDFDNVVPRNLESAILYARVLTRIIHEEHLPPFDRGAVVAIIEHGARVATARGKLTTRFGRLADIAREAAFLAGKKSERPVTGATVREAVHRGKRRADLPSRHFRELLADGTIRVELHGSVIGQINGLAVLRAGPLTYGFPARITATIGPGTAGVINIEREAALSGAIHTKGFYILGGLLRHLLQTDHPLAFDASVAFEQSYGGIDGDSASGAEVCCLLSALTEIPIRQELAMTGAIDQLGHVLAVGAINEKIEGFYDACNDVGLSGTQGVIIPRANAGDLMLRQDVVDVCSRGLFRVVAVETIHEALECLTGVRAGERNEEGWYQTGTVLARAVERACDFWLKVAQGANVPASSGGR